MSHDMGDTGVAGHGDVRSLRALGAAAGFAAGGLVAAGRVEFEVTDELAVDEHVRVGAVDEHVRGSAP